MSSPTVTTHRPGLGGLFDTSALCGASINDGPLRMHEWEYDCPACKRMSGEHVDVTSAGGVNTGRGDSAPSRGAGDAPDEVKGAASPSAAPAPLAFALAFAALLTIAVILAGLAIQLAHSPPH